MKIHRLFILLPAAALALLAAACAAHDAAPPVQTPPATEADTTAPAPAATGFPALPPPADLARASSAAIAGTLARGSDFDPALPNQGVETRGRIARFTMPVNPELPYHEWPIQASYAVYRFNLAGYSGPSTITASHHGGSFQVTDAETGVSRSYKHSWLALANWQTGRWRWHEVPDDTDLDLGSLAPYTAPDGTVLLIWLQLSRGEAGVLNWLRFGDSGLTVETPGTEGMALSDLTFTGDGQPALLGHGDAGRRWLLERSTPGWNVRELTEEQPATYLQLLSYDPAGLPWCLGITAGEDRQPGYRYRDVGLIDLSPATAGYEPVSALSWEIPPPPPGPGGPGGGYGPDSPGRPPVRDSHLVFDAAGSPLLTYQRDGLRLAWRDGDAWGNTPLPATPRDLALDANGAPCILCGDNTYSTSATLLLQRYNGSGWEEEALPLASGFWDARFVAAAGGLQVAASQLSGPLRLFSREAGGWAVREIAEPAGHNPIVLDAATLAGGKLRLAAGPSNLSGHRRWLYTEEDAGGLTAWPLDLPYFGLSGARFDSAGRLHAVGRIGRSDDRQSAYVREW